MFILEALLFFPCEVSSLEQDGPTFKGSSHMSMTCAPSRAFP